MQDSGAVQYRGAGDTRACGILGDPVLRLSHTVIDASLALTHGDREAAITGTSESISHKSLDGAEQLFQVRRVAFQNVKQRVGANPGIGPYHGLHVILPSLFLLLHGAFPHHNL